MFSSPVATAEFSDLLAYLVGEMEKGKEIYTFDCTPLLSPLTLIM